MTTDVRCGNVACGKTLRIKDEFAGKRVKCPSCGHILAIPAAPPPAPPVTALAVAEEEAAPPAPRPRERPPERPPERSRRRSRERRPRDDEPPGAHQLSDLGVGWVILLNVVTIGLFSSIWFNLMHGRLPRRRSDDPSAAKAIGFLFIPFFNFYWFFFTYLRLITRLNEQREFRGLRPSRLHGLVIAFCVIHLVSTIILSLAFPPGVYVNPVSMVLGCVLFSIIQGRVNELVEASALVPARDGTRECPRCAERVKAAAMACRYCDHEFGEADRPQQDVALERDLRRLVCRHRRRLCLTWGCLLSAIGLFFLAILIPYVLGINVPPPPDGPDLPARVIGTVFFTVPLLVPAAICLIRARAYGRELADSAECADSFKGNDPAADLRS